MKALMGIGFGKVTDNVSIREMPLPVPGSGEVLIKVKAVSINPIDYKIVQGVLNVFLKLKIPYTLGFDLAGVVEQNGPDSGLFQKGDEVFGRVADTLRDAFGEYALAREQDLARKPEKISFAEAASVPLVGLTTIQAFSGAGGLKKGETILIHAGSGGIGTFAVQYARFTGAHVTATTSTRNMELVKSLGAERVIDYKQEDYRLTGEQYDFIYDTLGGAYTKDSLALLKEGGRMVSIAGPPDASALTKFGIKGIIKWVALGSYRKLSGIIRKKKLTYHYLYMHSDGKALEEIGSLMEKGKIKAVIDQTWNFVEFPAALAYVEKGHTRGKVVVQVSS